MQRFVRCLGVCVAVVLTAVSLVAQQTEPLRRRSGVQFALDGFSVAPLRHAPFSVTVQDHLPDGSGHTAAVMTRLTRSSSGVIREERLLMPAAGSTEEPHLLSIHIIDAYGHREILFDPSHHAAMEYRMPLILNLPEQPWPSKEALPRGSQRESYVDEGAQVLDGVVLEQLRGTLTRSSEYRSVVIASREILYSPALGLVIPERSGRAATPTAVLEISLSEPPGDGLAVPAGYTVVTTKRPPQKAGYTPPGFAPSVTEAWAMAGFGTAFAPGTLLLGADDHSGNVSTSSNLLQNLYPRLP